MNEESRPVSEEELAKMAERDEAARLVALEEEAKSMRFEKGHAKSQQEKEDLAGQ